MFYVLDENGNRQEGLTKEEVLSILQQAINEGSLAGIEKDSAFVSKLKCCVDGGTFKMAFITQAKFNELKANSQLDDEALYFITDDTTEAVLEETIEKFANDLEAFEKTIGEFHKEIEDVKEELTTTQRKKIIFSGEQTCDDNTSVMFPLTEKPVAGDILEITASIYNGKIKKPFRFVFTPDMAANGTGHQDFCFSYIGDVMGLAVNFYGTQMRVYTSGEIRIQWSYYCQLGSTTDNGHGATTVYEVAKIIE